MIFDLGKLSKKERKELAGETRKHYADHYKTILEKYGFMRDESNARSFDAIADYFARWYAGEKGICDLPEKGLFLYGKKGTGKTTIMNIFSGLFEIDIIPVEELTVSFTIGREKAFWDVANDYRNSSLIVDDVCNEQTVKAYGNAIPIPEFFKAREYSWRYDGIYTFYTSNATSRDEITKLYGDTITSRILGMCEFIKIEGIDHRI